MRFQKELLCLLLLELTEQFFSYNDFKFTDFIVIINAL